MSITDLQSTYYSRTIRYGQDQLRRFLKRLFDRTTSFTNENLEIFTLDPEDRPGAQTFEEFFGENEQYPCITLEQGQSRIVDYGFKGALGQVTRREDIAGQNNLTSYDTLGGPLGYGRATRLQVTNPFTVVGVDVILRYVSGLNENITVKLHEDNAGVPGTVLGTATISFVNKTVPTRYVSEFDSTVDLLSDTDYWVSFSTSTTSTYYLYGMAGDYSTAMNSVASPNWTTFDDAIYSVNLIGKSGIRIGGGVQYTINVHCMSTAYDLTSRLSDISLFYINLNRWLPAESFFQMGISIIGEYTMSKVEDRKRGEDKIYIKTLGVPCHGDFYLDYELETLKDLVIDDLIAY